MGARDRGCDLAWPVGDWSHLLTPAIQLGWPQQPSPLSSSLPTRDSSDFPKDQVASAKHCPLPHRGAATVPCSWFPNSISSQGHGAWCALQVTAWEGAELASEPRMWGHSPAEGPAAPGLLAHPPGGCFLARLYLPSVLDAGSLGVVSAQGLSSHPVPSGCLRRGGVWMGGLRAQPASAGPTAQIPSF